MTTKYQNFINGKWQDSKSGKFFENRNPANWDGDLIGTFPLSTKEDVDEAVAAAKEAFKKWRLVPAPKRGDVLKRVGDMMNETKDEIAFEMTREMGKVFAETKAIHRKESILLITLPRRADGSLDTTPQVSFPIK